jgi:hypothetical protein
MDKKLARLGLMVVAMTTLCSCNNNNNNDDDWKYPKTLYVEYFKWEGYGNTIKTIKNIRAFSNDEHSKASYRYDGNTLFVRESKEDYTTEMVDGSFVTKYLGTWSEESTYEYVRCPFWVIV